MDIELGVQNVARPTNFSTDESADNVSQTIVQTMVDNTTINLTDDKGRRTIAPAKTPGYAIVGSETKHAVGLGAL